MRFARHVSIVHRVYICYSKVGLLMQAQPKLLKQTALVCSAKVRACNKDAVVAYCNNVWLSSDDDAL
jgi:hypothetical protein